MPKPSPCHACTQSIALPFDFTMAFQPIVTLATRRIWGYEALVRGTQGQGAASILSLVTDENRYRFDQSCRVKAIEEAHRLFVDPETRLSINFMPNAVYEPAACIQKTLETAQRVGFSRERIMFEFTEEERMGDVTHVSKIVAAYRRFGFITAIDDFGAGYSGLNLLAALTPDLIKIDMALVRDIHLSRAKQAIVAGVVSIARALDITVLAEGVERIDELHALHAAGIDLFQGYLFARPVIGQIPDCAVLADPGLQGAPVTMTPEALGDEAQCGSVGVSGN